MELHYKFTSYAYATGTSSDASISASTIAESKSHPKMHNFYNASDIISIRVFMLRSFPIRFDSTLLIKPDSVFPIRFESHCINFIFDLSKKYESHLSQAPGSPT